MFSAEKDTEKFAKLIVFGQITVPEKVLQHDKVPLINTRLKGFYFILE